jgi:hypothetical protein
MPKNLYLGPHLLVAHNDSEFRAIVRSGAPAILLEELARQQDDRLPFVATYSRAPALRIMYTGDPDKTPEGGWHPEMGAVGWFVHTVNETAFYQAVDIARGRGLYLRALGPIEPHLPDLDHYRKYGWFEAHRAALMYDAGARAVIGNFAVGTTTPENLTAFFKGVLAYLSEHGRLDVQFNIGLHEYGYIWPWTWLGGFQGNDINPSPGQIPAIPEPGELGWLIGRFQIIYQLAMLPELSALRLDQRTIDITETGLDVVESSMWNLPKLDGEPYGGFRTCTGYWAQYFNIDWQNLYRLLLHWIAAYYSQFRRDDGKEGGIGIVIAFAEGVHHTKPEWPDGQFYDFDVGATEAVRAFTEDNPWLPLPDAPPEQPPPQPLSEDVLRAVMDSARLAESRRNGYDKTKPH